nr:Fe(3+)-hydroxamate ABC transporter substrate-binding protein FhuD [uncultured Erwinia sp.]
MPSDVHPSRRVAGKTSSGVDFPRRRLLTALALLPLLPLTPARAALPQRIIALEWLPLEMLFALGVTPLGAADTHDYSIWVGEPAIPPTVLDIGRRSEPNLEYIAELRPDLLLYSEGYGPRSSQLNAIAPSMEFSFTSEQGEPLRTVSDGLRRLADRLDKTQAGQAHLAWFDRQLEEARGQLAGFRRQPLLVFTLVDDRHVMILGKNSLFGNVMARLGIENAWQGDDNGWGTAMVGLQRLATLPPLRAICLDHRDEQARARVAATPLWQAIPFVRDNMLRTVPALWIFGATLSALRFCRMLQQQEQQW